MRIRGQKPVEPRKRAPGAGRPKLDPDRRRSEGVYVSMSIAEKALFEADARRECMTLSFLVRKRLGLPINGAITRQPVPEG